MKTLTYLLFASILLFGLKPLQAQVQTRVSAEGVEGSEFLNKGLRLAKQVKEHKNRLRSEIRQLKAERDALSREIKQVTYADSVGVMEQRKTEIEGEMAALKKLSKLPQNQLPDSTFLSKENMLAVVNDTTQRRLDTWGVPEIDVRHYKDLAKQNRRESQSTLSALKKERRALSREERHAHEDSLLSLRIRINELTAEIAAIEQTLERKQQDSLLRVIRKELLDSAELANWTQSFMPEEWRNAGEGLGSLTPQGGVNAQALLTGSEGGMSNPVGGVASPPRPKLPKYNTLATDLMSPDAFTDGKFKGKEKLVDQAHQQLGELKQKYATVPNSEELKSAVKRNSLKDEPAGRRVFLSGTNNIRFTRTHMALQFTGQIGYRFNKPWRAGIGGSVNTAWYLDKPYARWDPENRYSWHVFSQYTFFKRFVAHLEFEPVKTPARTEIINDEMRHKLLVGVGKIFAIPKIKKLDGIVLLLYDTTSGDRFGSRFKVRFGVTSRL